MIWIERRQPKRGGLRRTDISPKCSVDRQPQRVETILKHTSGTHALAYESGKAKRSEEKHKSCGEVKNLG